MKRTPTKMRQKYDAILFTAVIESGRMNKREADKGKGGHEERR